MGSRTKTTIMVSYLVTNIQEPQPEALLPVSKNFCSEGEEVVPKRFRFPP